MLKSHHRRDKKKNFVETKTALGNVKLPLVKQQNKDSFSSLFRADFNSMLLIDFGCH